MLTIEEIAKELNTVRTERNRLTRREKELVEEFRGICRNIGISQASVFKKFIADFVEKYR